MKSKSLFAFVFAGSLTLGLAGAAVFAEDKADTSENKSVAAASQPATGPATTQAKLGKPINKMCPVMTDDEIDPEILVLYKGKTIGMCCDDCVEDFNKEPEKYAKNIKKK